MLERVSPETATRLFNNTQITFASLLAKYKEGKSFAGRYTTQYSEYREKLTNTLNYVEKKKNLLEEKAIAPLKQAKANVAKLDELEKNTEALQQFIRERKRMLIEQALQHAGKSKYLQKIDKNTAYYFESLRNYKQTFSDPKKSEELAVKILQKIPAFNEFIAKNSFLSSLFRLNNNGADPASLANLAGLQSRVDVNNLIQQTIAAGGPNAQEQLRQNLQSAQAQLNDLKNRYLNSGANSGDIDMPGKYKYNSQRAKKFRQKWELGLNLQNNRSKNFMPAASDIGISAGFRPHEKFVAGVGLAGKVGWGRSLRDFTVSYEGISGRFFSELKVRGSFHATAGFEMNYRSVFNNLSQLQDYSAWQKSGLIGISKVVSLKSKTLKKFKTTILWDFLSYTTVPRSQPIIFRFGYSLK
jgi:hypothetical protein